MESKRHFCGIHPTQLDIDNYKAKIAEVRANILTNQLKTAEYSTLAEDKIEIPIVFHVITGLSVPAGVISQTVTTLNGDFGDPPTYAEDVRGEYAFTDVRGAPNIEFVSPETRTASVTNEGEARFEIITPPIGASRLVHYPADTENTDPISSSAEVQLSLDDAIEVLTNQSAPDDRKMNVYIYGVSRSLYGFAAAIGDTNIVAISVSIPEDKNKGNLTSNLGTGRHILSHEIGHAFGLLHTFAEGGYLGDKDDTPPQEFPSTGNFFLITDTGNDGLGAGAVIKGSGCGYEKDRLIEGKSVPARLTWPLNGPLIDNTTEYHIVAFRVGCTLSSMSESVLDSLIAAFTTWCTDNGHPLVECLDCVHTTSENGADFRLHVLFGRIDREGNTTLANAAVGQLLVEINSENTTTDGIALLCGGFKALSTDFEKEDNVSVYATLMGYCPFKAIFVPLNDKIERGGGPVPTSLTAISQRLQTLCSVYPKVFPCGYAGEDERYGITFRIGGFTSDVRQVARDVLEDVLTGGFDSAITSTLGGATRDTMKLAYSTEPLIATSSTSRHMATNIMDYSEYPRMFTNLQSSVMRLYASKLIAQETPIECPTDSDPGIKLVFKGDVFKVKSGQSFPSHENVYTALSDKRSGRNRYRIAAIYEGTSQANNDIKAVDTILRRYIHSEYYEACKSCSTVQYDDISDRSTLSYRVKPIEGHPEERPLTVLKQDVALAASRLSSGSPPQSLINDIEKITGKDTLIPESTTASGVSLPLSDNTIGFSSTPFLIALTVVFAVIVIIGIWFAFGRFTAV